MKKEDINGKEEFITTFFDEFEKKISNLDQMVKLGFVEETLILACCYIGALAKFRYDMSDDRENFIKIIYEHSDHKASFSKISWINFYKKGEDISDKNIAGKPISRYKDIKAALLKIFDKKSDHHQEMDKNGVINYLKQQISNLDLQNLEANLDKFSYAAVLYEEYRSVGVHKGSIGTSWDVETGKPLFERNEQEEDIYYNDNRLCFSKEIILSVLKSVYLNLKKQCLTSIKWPHEL